MVFGAVSCTTIKAQGPVKVAIKPPTSFDLDAIDRYLATYIKARGFVGLSVAIAHQGKLVLVKGYGNRSLAPVLPVVASTPFPTGSVSKQFTSTCMLLLAERGRLSLDDPVAKYYPEVTRASDVTLYDLATHVSGYPDSYPFDFVDLEMRQPVTPDEIIARYGRRPLDFEPRTRWSYTGTGYVLLGRIVEKASGKSLNKLMEEQIFLPLGMTRSAYTPRPAPHDMATGYTSFASGPPEVAIPEADDWNFGAGGLVSTATDLAKWDLALMDGKILKPDSFARLVTPRTLADGESTTYGCGISVSRSHNLTVLEHDGEQSGFQSFNAFIPHTKSALVLLSNRDDIDLGDLANDLVRAITNEAAPTVQVTGPSVQETVRSLFIELQSGQVNRLRFGPDFNAYLTDARVSDAHARFSSLGVPMSVKVERVRERGGMEQSWSLIVFGSTTLEVQMFRSTDGKIQQYLLQKQW